MFCVFIFLAEEGTHIAVFGRFLGQCSTTDINVMSHSFESLKIKIEHRQFKAPHVLVSSNKPSCAHVRILPSQTPRLRPELP